MLPDMRDPFIMPLIVISALLIIWRHRANMQRIRSGTENRLW
jgi:glycerol-3-phosphate acyltransferase PlsY